MTDSPPTHAINVPDRVTIRCTPALRRTIARLIANEDAKMRSIGSLLPAPSASDIVRSLVEHAGARLDAEEAQDAAQAPPPAPAAESEGDE